ncbi:MAG: acetoacetate--CoA ligase [Betaproteobacteria bacterium]|nr:acetoacetate--CoA ligase [Betaproteobacteria bacterium]
MTDPTPIWCPSADRIARSRFTHYRSWLERRYGLRFTDYESMWQWSVDELESFWSTLWEYFPIRAHTPYDCVLDRRTMPGAKWFAGATLNYAEHSLAAAFEPDAERRLAIVCESETRAPVTVTWAGLARQVGAVTHCLAAFGIQPGDRVASYMPNIPESVVALLATASVGGVWSSCSPDMGVVSVLDRFRQISPRMLFAVDGYRYGGKRIDRREIVAELVAGLPSLEAVVFVPYLDPEATFDATAARPGVSVVRIDEVLARPAAPQFTPVPFDHPLWIVYSSGTTGMPKPIVHGHGGIVLENFKGIALHLDVGRDDRFFWFSSTSWIMWNLLVSTLATGCTILQFDGNPGHPDLSTLWRFAERHGATFFGTSPAFLGLCMKAGLSPRGLFDLSALRALGNTGSPLTEEGYRWVYEHVGPDLLLASISGGTDPAAAFVGACPVLPVRAGEMQCRPLGTATYAFDDEGRPVYDQVGELVCTLPLPSMPLYFWGDTDGRRYHESYFDVYPGVWRHGDWLRLIRRPESVTAVIYGRSDSTINRHGIRMGTAELYRVVEEFSEVTDSLVIDLEYLGRESFMALFVVLRDPAAGVSSELRDALLAAIRTRLSARHVPNEVIAIPDVPRTISGKKLEVPIKKILLGQPVDRAVNRDSMANPGALDWFVDFARRRARDA